MEPAEAVTALAVELGVRQEMLHKWRRAREAGGSDELAAARTPDRDAGAHHRPKAVGPGLFSRGLAASLRATPEERPPGEIEVRGILATQNPGARHPGGSPQARIAANATAVARGQKDLLWP